MREDSGADSPSLLGSREEEVDSSSDTDEEDGEGEGPLLTPETPPVIMKDYETGLAMSVDLSSSVMHSSVLDMEVGRTNE